jgi:hypothetical protein
MPIATVAIDLANTVFELAAADENGQLRLGPNWPYGRCGCTLSR